MIAAIIVITLLLVGIIVWMDGTTKNLKEINSAESIDLEPGPNFEPPDMALDNYPPE